ncbi:phage tail protein [Pikeienuella piscinae]|uniref:Phage tail protein n=1 Tax=Pikeienuella piscinae TaxID=2748098 RepID=A0A7L5BWD7_9RHOB|nr:phage tail protein [Pikeienuella piscinae]QIE56032.1 phage tail protein [Pikeienuella piscinae]
MVDATLPFAYEFQPPVGFHFRVDFDLAEAGEQDIRFREVTGLSMELEEESYAEGGENRFTHKFPVRGSYPPLVLKRGLMTDSTVAAWVRDAVQNFTIRPATVWVTLLNDAHEPLETYTVVNAWPKKWVVSDFNAEASEIVVETLELAYAYFRVN